MAIIGLISIPIRIIIYAAASSSKSDYDFSHLYNYKNSSYTSYGNYASSTNQTSSYYVPPKSNYSSKSTSKSDDPYNVKDYSNADYFYDDHYDDFFDYYDAETYYYRYK